MLYGDFCLFIWKSNLLLYPGLFNQFFVASKVHILGSLIIYYRYIYAFLKYFLNEMCCYFSRPETPLSMRKGKKTLLFSFEYNHPPSTLEKYTVQYGQTITSTKMLVHNINQKQISPIS